MTKKIVAIGGGENGRITSDGTRKPYETGPIDQEIIHLTGKENPHFLFLAHSQDTIENENSYFETMQAIYNGRFGCECKHLLKDQLNDIEYVKVWAHKQLRLISDLFKIHKLYNYISLDFKKVGPENADNYLLVFDISSRKEFANSFKKMMLQILFYSIVAGIILFFI